MIPSIKTTFNLTDKTVTVQDIFDYSGLTFDTAYGNVIARLGNTIFHTNTNFDSSADIVVGTNDSVTFDLLVDGNGKVLPGSYSFEYSVKINGETIIASATVDAPVGSPFSYIELNPASQSNIDAVQDNLDLGGVQTITFKNGGGGTVATGVPSSTTGDNTINFANVTTASFATIAIIAVTAVTTYTKTFTYAYVGCDVVTPNLCVSSDCYTSQLTAIDATAYPSYITLTRSLVIQYPRLANGSPVQAAVSTQDSSKTIGPNIYTGNYTVSLSSAMTWVQDDGLYLSQTVTAYEEENVQCTDGLCGLSACINAYRVQYMEALRLGSRDLQKLEMQTKVISLYCNQINIAIDCQDTDQATTLTSELATFMNTQNPTLGGCSCGCSDSSGSYTEPTVIYPLFGPSYALNLQNITDNGDTTTNPITAASFTDDNGAVKPYKVYVANLTQTASNAPVPTDLENNLSIDQADYSWDSDGVFFITKVGGFPLAKTTYEIAALPTFASNGDKVTVSRVSDNVLQISTSNQSNTGTNGLLANTKIEIRVYN